MTINMANIPEEFFPSCSHCEFAGCIGEEKCIEQVIKDYIEAGEITID